MTDILETIKELVVSGKFKEIEEQTRKAIDSSVDLNRIINDALISAMDIVGKKFADGDIYVPEMLVSATTMKRGLDIIKPLLRSGEAENRGTILMGTVKGDLHDIGKNLVTMMLEGAGFRIIDLGAPRSGQSNCWRSTNRSGIRR
jgi:methanogenic corrinoid protein MtbC1